MYKCYTFFLTDYSLYFCRRKRGGQFSFHDILFQEKKNNYKKSSSIPNIDI